MQAGWQAGRWQGRGQRDTGEGYLDKAVFLLVPS